MTLNHYQWDADAREMVPLGRIDRIPLDGWAAGLGPGLVASAALFGLIVVAVGSVAGMVGLLTWIGGGW